MTGWALQLTARYFDNVFEHFPIARPQIDGNLSSGICWILEERCFSSYVIHIHALPSRKLIQAFESEGVEG